ncbi:hypothetical protein H6F44_03325 [Pseudanabaena sp. FACHB-1277]|uniref:Uncharacterized protein n=1 Tax=Pseudanabaena cinerea FACHB-1277 TaxID=2949581 RepID=A0A926UQ53_9CYAN|nr:hypothetical protein [Pseudanabaena cinerea]MBD2149160.1 hypothetical protein [Pseudanabaena cinerea FACHB-1277]
MQLVRKFLNKITSRIVRSLKLPMVILVIIVGVNVFAGVLVSCSSDNSKTSEKTPPSVPVFLFLQASPDGQTLDGVIPSDLLERLGGINQVIQSIPAGSQLSLSQFGKALVTLKISEVRGSDAFGAIASFKVAIADGKPNFDPAILRQSGLTMVAHKVPSTGEANSDAKGENKGENKGKSDRRYFFNCPQRIQPLVLSKSQQVFTQLGAASTDLPRVAIASLVCVDMNNDNQPEIIAGLRLDNAIRPVGFDTQAWQSFLSLPVTKRQEFSVLVLLERKSDAQNNSPSNNKNEADWSAVPIFTHTRALAYINDSVSSYAIFGIEDLNGDRYPEIMIKEIGLNSIDVKVLSSSLDAQGNWTWQNYYQNQRSLNILQ